MRHRQGRPLPQTRVPHRKLPAKIRHSTVQPRELPVREMPPLRMPKARVSKLPPRRNTPVARIVDEAESSLLDLIDNLLAKGVMLNADLILALADVDLVYIRLSALLCAADRVLPTLAGSSSARSGVAASGRTGV